jgi:MFS family permease
VVSLWKMGIRGFAWARRLGLPPVQGRGGLVAALVVDSLGSGLFVPFAVLYFLRTTTLSLTTVGAGLTLAGLVALPVPLALGQLIDRWQPKNVVAAGNLVSGAAFVGYLFVGSRLELVVAALAANIGQRTFWTATRALVAQIAGPADRRAWFAFQSMVRNAGYGVGGLLGAAAVSLHTVTAFHALALLNAVSYLAAALLLLRWTVPASKSAPESASGPDAAAAPPHADQVMIGYRSVLSDRRLWIVTATNLVVVLCQSVLSVLLTVYVVDTLHEPAWAGGALYALNTALVVLAQTSITRITTHTRATAILRAAALSWTAGFGILWVLGVTHPHGGGLLALGLLGFGVLFTVAEMLSSPTMNSLAVELAPPQALGRYLAIFQTSWSAGTALAPALLTWLLSLGPGWPWATLIALCAATIVATSTPSHCWPRRTA